jgi:hypothetical protein
LEQMVRTWQYPAIVAARQDHFANTNERIPDRLEGDTTIGRRRFCRCIFIDSVD